MTALIIIFAALILLAGIAIVINPELVFAPLRESSEKLELHVLAIVARLVIGMLLISQSYASKFPYVIEIIGWLSIIAAIILAVIGRSRFKRLMSWAFSFLASYGRVGGVIAIIFGAFIFYSFV